MRLAHCTLGSTFFLGPPQPKGKDDESSCDLDMCVSEYDYYYRTTSWGTRTHPNATLVLFGPKHLLHHDSVSRLPQAFHCVSMKLKSSLSLLAPVSLLAIFNDAKELDSSPVSSHNANHIFNAIHDSMRQWDSSVLHNGMSVFLAYVPEDTQLYHGTSTPDRVNGTEWLAFEPEHALVFARPRRGPPPGRDRPLRSYPSGHGECHPPCSVKDDSDQSPHSALGPSKQDANPPKVSHAELRQDQSPLSHTLMQRGRARTNYDQALLSQQADRHGYLHTYRTKHSLRLLYLDGQSAAKSSIGTLDLQDMVLLHDNPPPKHNDREASSSGKPATGQMEGRIGGPMGEVWRAEHLCTMAENRWAGKIDGFLRMELGFEIILCTFKDHLKVDRITEVTAADHGGHPGSGSGSIDYYKAVASRFDGIGGDRVTLNYENFVNLFAFPDAVYFDEHERPRVNNATAVLKPVQNAIDEMILGLDKHRRVNWQTIADMVIARYGDRLESLASGSLDSISAFRGEIDQAMQPFVDHGSRNASAEILRCATQYLPRHSNVNTLAVNAIFQVTTTLCSSLAIAAQHDVLEDAVRTIRSLKSWLNWPSFKRCRGCSYDEVCFVPIWPLGGVEDMKNPRCISDLADTSRGYWGKMDDMAAHDRRR